MNVVSLVLVRSVISLSALALWAALALGCGSGGELRSERERVVPAAAPPAEFTRANTRFAFDLYQRLREQEGNLFFSPHSISTALAMTYAGARGETERQMAETLHYRLPGVGLHAAFNALDQELARRGEGDDGFRLNIVNAVWGQSDHDFLAPFLDLLAEHYGAGVRPVDFRAAPQQARDVINDWVAEQTENRITDLIPPDVIDVLTRLVLTNAIYFNASWVYPFDPDGTQPGAFHLLDGGEVELPMMRLEEELGYAQGDGWQAVELPYEGYELSMLILLPDEGRFREFEGSLNADLLDQMVSQLWYPLVALELPRFEFDSRFELADTLKAMGMTDAFDRSRADFSAMDGRSCLAGDPGCLRISNVVHQAFVSVDEEGTEAAAATAVVMKTQSAPPERIVVSVDRPFLFLIRDRATGAILFLAASNNPNKALNRSGRLQRDHYTKAFHASPLWRPLRSPAPP